MFDFLTGVNYAAAPAEGEVRLPRGFLAHPRDLSCRGILGFHEWNSLSALQLAARLGYQRMCKHMLKKRLRTNWIWGPLASY